MPCPCQLSASLSWGHTVHEGTIKRAYTSPNFVALSVKDDERGRDPKAQAATHLPPYRLHNVQPDHLEAFPLLLL